MGCTLTGPSWCGSHRKVCRYLPDFMQWQTHSHWKTKHHRQRVNFPLRNLSLPVLDKALHQQTNLFVFGVVFSVNSLSLLPLEPLPHLFDADGLFLHLCSNSQYKRSQMLLSLKPQTSATSRCKGGTTFSTIFTALVRVHLAITLVAIWRTRRLKG